MTDFAKRRSAPTLISLMATTSLFGAAWALGLPASALAQTAPAPQSTTPEDERREEAIEVRGVRQQLQEAAAIERAADNIITVITADDIGQFPDQNVAESLQRLPGLTIIRDEGEGRFVTVRGLSPGFTQVTISNAQLGSSSTGSRSVALDVIPSDLLSQLSVAKTILPDTDHDSLGAKIDLRPLSAFDRTDEFTGRITAQGTTTLRANEVRPRVSADLTRRFDLGVGEFGVAAAFNYFSREIDLDELQSDSGFDIRIFDGVTIGGQPTSGELSPSEIDQRVELGRRNRLGGTLSLDYEIGERHDWTFSFLIGRLDDDDIRIQQEVELGDAANGEIISISPNGGQFTDVDIDRQIFFQPRVETTFAFHFEGRNDFGDDRWTLSYAADFSRNDFTITPGLRARFRESDLVISGIDLFAETADFTVDGQGDLNGGGGFSSGIQNINFGFRPGLDDFAFNELLVINEDRSDQILSYNVDLERRANIFSRPASFKVGFKQRFRERSFIRGENSLEGADLAPFLGNIAPRSLADVPAFTPSSSLNLDGDLAEGFVVPELEFTRAFLQELAAASGIQPDNLPENFDVSEDTISGYFQGEVELADNFQVIFGVRVEHTDYTAVGTAETEVNFNDILIPELSTIGVQTFRNSYTNFFPGIHFKWDISDTVTARASYSRGQVRPSFDDASPLLELALDLEAPTGDPGQAVINATLPTGVTPVVIGGNGAVLDGGNPLLEPLIAEQFDINLGWYPSPNLTVTVAGFYKLLRDTFVSLSTEDPADFELLGASVIDPVTGVPLTQVDTVVNGDQGNLFGAEIGFSYFFKDSLPGLFSNLFFSGNVTLISSRDGTNPVRPDENFRLVNQSSVIANASLGYEGDKLLIRASGNFRGNTLDRVDSDSFADLLIRDFISLDLSVRYNITERFQIFADVTNLNNEREASVFRGNDVSGQIFESVDTFGRTFQFGVVANF